MLWTGGALDGVFIPVKLVKDPGDSAGPDDHHESAGGLEVQLLGGGKGSLCDCLLRL